MAGKDDIIKAISNIDLFLKTDKLKGATVRMNQNGKPYFFAGGFTLVFQLEKESKKWAFRIWHTNFENIKERFQKISQYLVGLKLPYFADFIYEEKALLINGDLVDVIYMEWLDGLLLKDYLKQNLYNKQNLLSLAESFLTMFIDLHGHKIAHGDLQHGNIFIDNNHNIKLIDYDSICVPTIEGENELVTGLIGYQHPSRINSKTTTSPKADYFSELIIYISIIALANKPSLWVDYNVEHSETLLFSDEDFKNIVQSNIYNDLITSSDELKDLLYILTEYLKCSSYLDLKPIELYLNPPEIINFSFDKDVVISGQIATLSWEVKGANSIKIDEIGEVELEGSTPICLRENSIYKLVANSPRGSVQQEACIIIFPTPLLKTLLVPAPEFDNRIILSSLKVKSPEIDVSINMPRLKLEQPNLNLLVPKFVEFSDDSHQSFIFSFSKIYQYIKKYVKE